MSNNKIKNNKINKINKTNNLYLRWATTKCSCIKKNCNCKKRKYNYLTNNYINRCWICRKYTIKDGICTNDYCESHDN